MVIEHLQADGTYSLQPNRVGSCLVQAERGLPMVNGRGF